MKRLVVASDGTWNGALGKRASNVEKLARTIELDPGKSDVPQVVLYMAGVGTAGDRWDRMLGGLFGEGLSQNLLAAYRFLCANHVPGDEIYLVGFSRGAYMVRSLANLISRFGLVTREATLEERLPEVWARYRSSAATLRASDAAFTADHCHRPGIRFLGVFDTVGEVGVNGVAPGVETFHDVSLSPKVQTARQALAIDELRMKFSPWVWTSRDGATPTPDVRQVWFEGDHSDVGGGHRFSGLSDVTLLWMATEASRCGLVFDWGLLAEYVDSHESSVIHSNMNALWWTGNLWRSAIGRRRSAAKFDGRRRRLTPPGALGIKLAESTVRRYRERLYSSSSLAALEAQGVDLDTMTERLFDPVRTRAFLVQELRDWARP